MCSIQRDLENGMVTVKDTHLGSTAHYTCDDGYTLVGPDKRECLITGTWSGYTPVCVLNNSNASKMTWIVYYDQLLFYKCICLNNINFETYYENVLIKRMHKQIYCMPHWFNDK